jgi:hypothetical protein
MERGKEKVCDPVPQIFYSEELENLSQWFYDGIY